MKVLPPPGPQRRRQLVGLAVAIVLLVGVAWYEVGQTQPSTPAAPRPAASNPTVPTTTSMTIPTTTVPQAPSEPARPALPEALRLASLDPVSAEPSVGRNPFRFGVPPPPPVPAAPIVQQVDATPAPPPGPPPAPQVPLKFTGVFVVPDANGQTVRVALLSDGRGGQFRALEGQVIDGRYRVVKIGEESVIVEFVDGTGRRVIPLGGTP